MRVKCRWWSFENPAADGSLMTQNVFETYLRSTEYKDLIDSGTTLGSLTHRSRDSKCNPVGIGNLKGTVGKDDSLLIIGQDMPSPTHVVERLYAEDGWAWAEIRILDEGSADSGMSENIKRLKTLLRQGVMLPCSAVIVAYWDNQGGVDVCKKIQSIKGIDITLNPSQKGARITEILSDEIPEEKQFSSVFEKSFSDVKSLPKSSKIGGKFTFLKVKEFSNVCELIKEEELPKQKEFSIASLKERLMYSKLSPRQRFRRLIMDYKSLVKSSGHDGLDPESEKLLKSLFTTDILDIMKSIYPDIMKGKVINTLLGASSLGKSVRLASQQLQIPFKMAMQEQEKSGYISKSRYQKIQDAYLEFTNSLIEEVFGNPEPQSELDNNEPNEK